MVSSTEHVLPWRLPFALEQSSLAVVATALIGFGLLAWLALGRPM